jgi:hypothetical protein
MRITVVDADQCVSKHYPPNQVAFILDRDSVSTFYNNDDYMYHFCEKGVRRTLPAPLGIHPTQQQLKRQWRLQVKALLMPWIENPPFELGYFIDRLFATGMLDPAGARDGVVWPIEFVNNRELHLIKLPSVSYEEVEAAVLQLIGNYLQLPEHEVQLVFEQLR